RREDAGRLALAAVRQSGEREDPSRDHRARDPARHRRPRRRGRRGSRHRRHGFRRRPGAEERAGEGQDPDRRRRADRVDGAEGRPAQPAQDPGHRRRDHPGDLRRLGRRPDHRRQHRRRHRRRAPAGEGGRDLRRHLRGRGGLVGVRDREGARPRQARRGRAARHRRALSLDDAVRVHRSREPARDDASDARRDAGRGRRTSGLVTQDSNIAWLAVATHVVASAAMLLLLREGLPPASGAERIAYIAAHRAAWTIGWLTWQLAVVSLIALYAVLARRLGGPLPLPALAIGTAGAAIDIATNVRYIVILPRLGGDAFALLDRELEAMTGYAANGLYTLAFVLFVIAGRCVLPRLANALAVP